MISGRKKEINNPLLELILQKYIQTSRDSIRGPVALKNDKKLVTNKSEKKKITEIPDESKLQPTNLDGHTVSSFEVGGEIRICFSEIVQVVLKDVNVQEIFKKRDNLLIFTSKCSQKQLDELKYHGVLPWTTTSSNLISKSDAFRLIGALQGNLSPKADINKGSPLSFEVYHECFGGCIGQLEPELYISMNTPCIKCTECNGLFSTRKFVSHNHSSYDEVHTCHWGFDSTNWRTYTMLVEQNPTRDLCALWDSIRRKFDNTFGKHSSVDSSENKGSDADFMAYINSPDHKKAMVSPIENLRNREALSSGSAFRPWSPATPGSSKYSSNYSKGYSRFTFPTAPSHHISHSRDCPKSPIYLDCKQCSSAAQASCPSHFGGHPDPMERNPDLIKREREPGLMANSCRCESCKNTKINKRDTVEGSIEDVLRNFTSKDNQLTTSMKDIAQVLSNELKRLSITNEERVREFSISNQRLQTELQLVKIESDKKLNEARETKVHVEQELEMLHRERQKEHAIFSQLQWELQSDIAKRKESGSGSEVETLQKEVTFLKTHLEQTKIDRENLQKQLEWHVNHRKSHSNWKPFPTMAKQFSDDDENEMDTTPKSQKISVVASRDESREVSSPVTKSRRLAGNSDDSSDIEVDD